MAWPKKQPTILQLVKGKRSVLDIGKKPFARSYGTGVSRIQREGYDANGESWWDIRKRVLKRDDYTCVTPGCEVKEDPKNKIYLECHHIIPLSKGGTSTMNNLQSECKDCHDKHHKHLPAARKSKSFF